jgi:hypothetical protein
VSYALPGRTVLRGALLLACASALLALPEPARAQRVEVQGRGDPLLDRRIREVVADPATRLILRDTLLARGDTLRGPVAAIGITMRVEGVIEGQFFSIDSNIFIRPGAFVSGVVTNVAGGFFPSEFATVEAEIRDYGGAPYDVEPMDGGVRIVGLQRRRVLHPDGPLGIGIPTYDRVGGVTLRLGSTWYPVPPGLFEPRLHAWGGWSFGREDWVGGASVGFLGPFTTGEIGAERVTATSDEWTRNTLLNSLGMLVVGSDYRNYWAAERAFVRIEHDFGRLTTRFGALVEDAESLPARRLWSLDRPSNVRFNPDVSDGRIASVSLGISSGIDEPWTRASFGVDSEVGLRVAGGDFSFARYTADLEWAMNAFANHTLTIAARAQGPLPGTDSLPRQRWSLLGGLETLEPWPIGAFHGDRLALVRTSYGIPLDPFRVPLLGSPVIELVHAAGSAWTRETGSALEQALGVRLHFPLLHIHAFTDPSGDRDPVFGVGFRLRRSPAWEAAGF